MNDFLEISNVTKNYGYGKIAVNNVSIRIPRGKIIGLLGPNGSGKTTLIKLINGLLTPSEGSIVFAGVPIGIHSKEHISYLPDQTYLNMNQKVRSVINLFQEFYQDFDAERAYVMLESLGLSPDARLKPMSKGTKEKVQLILVMSRRASLYVLDEPIAGVDPAARDYILNTIITNYEPEASILISTHLIKDVENVLDEILFLKEGKLVRQSLVDELREQEGKSVDALFREVFKC